MTPAAAQPAPATNVPLPPHHVRDSLVSIWQQFDIWLRDFVLILPNLIVALVAAIVFVFLAWGVAVALRHFVARSGRQDLAHMLGSFAFWCVLFFGFLVVITIALPSMRPVDIFASLGVGSVALGFAFKDILQNWIAGFFILIRRPFHRGDQIKVGDIEGTVQAVETRATLVKTYSGRLVIIPNSDIYTRTVTVHTAYEHRRTEILVPVGMGVDLDGAMDVFRKAVLSVKNVLDDPPPDVLPWEFKDNNVNIRVRWWTKSQRTFEVRTRAAVVVAIKHAAEDAGIDIPADTTISFAETPLIVDRQPDAKKPKAHKKPVKPDLKAPPAEVELDKPADERTDPEAEVPQLGELNEGVDAVPR
jgi:small-conductance mechanosensitive channel